LTFTDAEPDDKRFGAAARQKERRRQTFNPARSGIITAKMGRSMSGRQGPAAKTLVAFDFDGTLTYRDSFLAFLAWRAGPVGWALGLMRLMPAAMGYIVHRDRGRLKAAAVRVFLRGVPREALQQDCQAFAASNLGKRLIRPDAEQCWSDWQARGAILAIVTASPEPVVAPFAERLGADVLIGTRLRFDAEGRIEGAFEGENCRGQEKIARLEARFGQDLRLAAAYGDTSGDREMLERAGIKGYRVFKGRRR
jgi:phosphatidylglycerophosphatase C